MPGDSALGLPGLASVLPTVIPPISILSPRGGFRPTVAKPGADRTLFKTREADPAPSELLGTAGAGVPMGVVVSAGRSNRSTSSTRSISKVCV